MDLEQTTELGKQSQYIDKYTPALLLAIPRRQAREAAGLFFENNTLPFVGVDVWNAYEISWLDERGKPLVAIATLTVPANSALLVESKSLKLYFNSFTMTKFPSAEAVRCLIQQDLQEQLECNIAVTLDVIHFFQPAEFHSLRGMCIDNIDLPICKYQVDAKLLRCDSEKVDECVYSNLLKSNCPVTNQPDWGSLEISYSGQQINHSALLKYIISFRNHCAFHETTVEKIFCDILERCQPDRLSVQARYTRRGGIDINPYRSTEPGVPDNIRLCRQ